MAATPPTTVPVASFHNPVHLGHWWARTSHHLHHALPYIIGSVCAVAVAACAVLYARWRLNVRRKQIDGLLQASAVLRDVRLGRVVHGGRPVRRESGKIVYARMEFKGDANEAKQQEFERAMFRRFGCEVNVEWAHAQTHPTVIVRKRPARPPLPGQVLHPALKIERGSLPFATAENAEIISWPLGGAAPHALVIGRTGSGKTVALRGLVIEACRNEPDPVIDILDPKRTSFRGLVGWPHIRSVTTEVDTMAAALDRCWQEMEDRYTAMQHGARQTDLPLLLVVVDELTELVARLKEAWDGKGEHPAVGQWRSLVRLGREARIHLLCGLQRPDAALIGGETRSNFGLSIGLGNLTPEAQRMIGADINATADHLGRAVVVVGTRQIEVQMWDTPNPANDLTGAERACLDALRPASRHASAPVRAVPIDPSEVPVMTRHDAESVLNRPVLTIVRDGTPIPAAALPTPPTEIPPVWDGVKPIPPVFYEWMVRLDGEGVSKAAIARALGVSRPAVSAYLNGRAREVPAEA